MGLTVPSEHWQRTAFAAGYTSGDVLAEVPCERRAAQERRIRGSYPALVAAIRPLVAPDARVLEVGPGAGSWTRALLTLVPRGTVEVVDYLDVRPWMPHDPRLTVHRAADRTLSMLAAGAFDFAFSFAVLCHYDHEAIVEILTATRRALRFGADAVHHYGDWHKLDALGWGEGCAPAAFREQPDADIWWPRNTPDMMAHAAERAGFAVVAADLGIFGRDSVIHLRAA